MPFTNNIFSFYHNLFAICGRLLRMLEAPGHMGFVCDCAVPRKDLV